MLTGYTANLPTDTLLSAGVLFCARNGAYVRIGVTDGAPDFDPASDLGEIMFDNRALSRLKGLSRVTGFASLMKGTLKEFGPSASGGQIALLEPGVAESLPAPAAPVLTPSSSGGTLTTGTYYYRVTALNAAGESAGSAEVSCSVTGPLGSVAIALASVVGATSYRVYRGTAISAENIYYTRVTNSFTDTGAAGTAGSPPPPNPATLGIPKPAGLMFAASDYITEFRWIFERAAGGYACIYAPLVICRKWSMKGVDKKEAQIAFEFEAVGDPVNDLSMAPYTVELRTSIAIQPPDGSNADVLAAMGTHALSFWDVATNTTLYSSNTMVAQIDDVRGVGAGPSLFGVQDGGGPTWKPLYDGVTKSCRTNTGGQTTLVTPWAGSSQYDFSQIRTIVWFGSAVTVGAGSYCMGAGLASNPFIAAHLQGGISTPETLLANLDPDGGTHNYQWDTRVPVGSLTPRLIVLALPQPTGVSGTELGALPFASSESPGSGRLLLTWPTANTFVPMPSGLYRIFFGGTPFSTNNVTFADIIFYGGLVLDCVPTRAMIAALERWAVRRGVMLDTTSVTKLVTTVGDSRTAGLGATNLNTDTWPEVLQRLLPSNYIVNNRGIAGDGFNNALDPTMLLPRFSMDHDGKRTGGDWCVIWEGVNSFNNGMTASDALNKLDTLVLTARADGKKVCVCQETNQTGGIPQQPAYNTGLDVRLAAGSIDAIARFADDTRLMDTTNATYFVGAPSFSLHYTTAGQAIQAQIVYNTIMAAGG